ncbi:MAG: hypothetical protein O7B99_06915 [Planctomycetota bacterium]|nr:hypothetical protein [Planctomycetota bacterium]
MVAGAILLWSGSAAGRRAWAVPLAIGLGFFVAHGIVIGWPSLLNPVSINQKVAHVAVAAAIWSALEVCASRLGRAVWVGRLLVVFGAVWWPLGFMREHHWTARESAAWTVVLVAAVAVGWGALEALCRRRHGFSLPLALAVACAGAGGALHFAKSDSLAQLAGALAAAIGAGVIVARWRPDLDLSPAAGPIVLVLAVLVLAGRFAAELSGPCALLVAYAPLAAWLGELPIVVGRRPWQAALVRVVLVAAPIMLAAWATQTPPSDDPYAH